ncbi:MAG: acyl-[acyl-carrier-protein] thioesterase [Lachnospiraceae bacterium]|nr:acyl-[acyl-carrier-protein] thioesterase [Lachnospiraceae bacterium]
MYSFEGRVRYSETDENEKLTLIAILNYFQDCSTFHAEDAGVGYDVLKKTGCFWVLNYWQIDVYRYPRMCEKITIGTSPYDCKGFLGFRNFYLDDAEGKRAAVGNTLWTFLNLNTGKPDRVPQNVIEAYGEMKKLDMEYEARKIKIPENVSKSSRDPFEVRRQHLDANNHVNNGQYVQMALDYVKRGFRVDRMRAEYKKAALLGDTMYPVVYESDGYCAVSLNDSDGKEYALVEFKCLN